MPMTHTLKGIVRYDGTDFCGWQRQDNGRTVQEELEKAFSTIANEAITIHGAGRTDAGVHALGQVFSCSWPRAINPRLRHAVSTMLEPEIQVIRLEEAAADFHARFAAQSKRYAYNLSFNHDVDPLAARYVWNVPFDVDLDCLRRLLPQLVGTHDFAGFQSTGHQLSTTVRTLYSVELFHGVAVGPMDGQHLWRIEFHGDGFLYKMVRNLTGTLIEIARGRFPESFLEEQLHTAKVFYGHCAPAHGLTMVEVLYDEHPAIK